MDNTAAALGRLEGWLGTMRGDGGYYGPVTGLRGTLLSWCGPGHDWRWEGLLDGWVALHARTGDPAYAARLDRAFADIRAAQQANGAFRNSYFEHNPVDGGMPYEPAMMAAVLRAVAHLRGRGSAWPAGVDSMAERFVEERLIKELWNKTLLTFNNWLQSEYEVYSPPAVAAIVETLCDYGELTGTAERWAPYVAGAGESLLKSQLQAGALAGALPVSNRDGASASPYLAARCLPALARLHRLTGDARYAAAGDRLADFVRLSWRADGALPFMAFAGRPARATPLFVGAAAGALAALARAQRPDAAPAAAVLAWVLGRQTESGAFETAAGFGAGGKRPDWRDVVPVCGWADKIYAVLASRASGPVAPVAGAPVRRPVMVKGKAAEFTEDGGAMRLSRGTDIWFDWKKRTIWPETCRL